MMISVNFKNNEWEVSFDGETIVSLPLILEQKAYEIQENLEKMFSDMMFFDLEEEEEDDKDLADK
jgi:hypothetical protein